MADQFYNQSSGSHPPADYDAIPDILRPGPHPIGADSSAAPAPQPARILPYPDRPGRQQKPQQQQQQQQQYSGSSSSAQYDSRPDATTYAPPAQYKPAKAKTPPTQPQTATGPWPRPPTAYSDTIDTTMNQGHGSPHTSSTGTSPAPFAMDAVAASLPNTTSSPPPAASPYNSPQGYQSQTHPQGPPPPVPGKVSQQLPPPVTTVPYANPPSQQTQPSPPISGQQASPTLTPLISGVAVGTAAAAYYASSGSLPPAPSQPYQQAQSPPPPTSPGYNQTSSGSPLPGPYGVVPGPPASPLPPQSPPPAYVNPVPTQPGPTSLPPKQQTPQPAPTQQVYMSGPPPIPGMPATVAFQPPPPTPGRPPQPASNSVMIDGKSYPIPAFINTIQTPIQCDKVLKEPYFGPYLRFKNLDLQKNLWMGTILLVLPSSLPPPRVEFHMSEDFSNLQAAAPQQIYAYADYAFFRYEIVVPVAQQEQKWTYAISTQTTQTWEFVVAGQTQQWRFIAWSCNDFSASVKQEDRDKLGFGTLWKDVMEKNVQEGGYHAQLGGGDQIYADRMWKEIPFLIEWLAIKGKEQRQHWPWKPEHEDIMKHAYFHYYTSQFAKPHLRDALARIPHVFQIDDHDIFDGYGSYPHHLQESNVFQGIGKIGFEFYLIFQHHTSREYLSQHPDPNDLITATGQGWSFIKYFGASTAIVGLDTRAERDKRRIMSQPSYDIMFQKLRQVPPSVVHCVIMIGVPIVYPRLEVVERALAGVQVAKRGINGAFNLLGKAVTTVTPQGTATQKTHSSLEGVKKAFGKSGMMSSLVSKFGEVDLLDDLMDHWTHPNHDRERTMVIRTLQEIAMTRRIRMTIVSGDVHCCGVGYLYDPKSPQDHKLMYQIITSAIVNVPPPGMVIKLLHNKDQLYVPQLNSNADTKVKSDTKEEMMELFARDVDGKDLGNLKKLLPRRNFAICRGGEAESEVWEICVERGRGSETIKYGPIVIPRLR